MSRPIQQRRPALVVAAGLGAAQDLLWVLMITAAANPRWPDDVEIDDHAGSGPSDRIGGAYSQDRYPRSSRRQQTRANSTANYR